jgi:hypothetical protein
MQSVDLSSIVHTLIGSLAECHSLGEHLLKYARRAHLRIAEMESVKEDQERLQREREMNADETRRREAERSSYVEALEREVGVLTERLRLIEVGRANIVSEIGDETPSKKDNNRIRLIGSTSK